MILSCDAILATYMPKISRGFFVASSIGSGSGIETSSLTEAVLKLNLDRIFLNSIVLVCCQVEKKKPVN